nr:LysM peptidoglycan-binding domain-containing protein [Candidatus Omnitrophota bacterium]
MPQIVYSEPSGNTGINALSSSGSGNEKQYYIVQKGDTLQKISEKFFGTTQKWKSIYDANKHILKSPDRIRPGQKLAIPKK